MGRQTIGQSTVEKTATKNTRKYNYERTEAVKDQFGKADKSFANHGEDRLERTQDKRSQYYFSADDERILMNISEQ